MVRKSRFSILMGNCMNILFEQRYFLCCHRNKYKGFLKTACACGFPTRYPTSWYPCRTSLKNIFMKNVEVGLVLIISQ